MRVLAFLLILSLPGYSQITTLEADIIPGSSGSDPQYLTAYNGKLYFSAFDGATNNGRELFSYDGNSVQLVADIFPGGLFSSEPKDLYVYGNKLFFSADDGVHGRELWACFGDSAYLVQDIDLNQSGNPQHFKEYNGILYFYDRELFATNGDSVWMVADFDPSGSSPSYLTVYNNKLFLRARTNNSLGYELYSYNGDSIKLEADIFPGSSGSDPRDLTVAGGNLFFSAEISGIGRELWKFDGTTATLVGDINAGSSSSNPQYLTEYNGKLYFAANDGVTGNEMWEYNGASLINFDLYLGGGYSYPREFEVFNNTLYISLEVCANNYGLSCYPDDLISFDGDTFQNVTTVFDNNFYPQYMTEFQGKLYFSAGNTTTGRELWSYTPDSLCIKPKNLNVIPENLSTVNLNWDLEPNAIGYTIRGTEVGTNGFVTITVNGGTTTSYKAKGLFSNKTYAWQVKSICDVGFESEYSAFDTFKIENFYCQMPVNYVTDITSTSAVLRWNVIPNAAAYWIIGRDINSPKIKSLPVLNPNQDSVWVQLAPGNTYAWQMRAECPAPPYYSFFTPVQFFSTPTSPVLKDTELGSFDFRYSDVSIYPNPMDEYTTIESFNEIIQEIHLYDLQGRLLRQEKVNTNKYQLQGGILSPGVYLAIVKTDGNEYREKLIVQ